MNRYFGKVIFFFSFFLIWGCSEKAPDLVQPADQTSVESNKITDSFFAKPLIDMTASEFYKGEEGGLYGMGHNDPPQSHLNAALDMISQIQPLDTRGRPSQNGSIVLLSIGMSNTHSEFEQFKDLAENDPDKSDKVVLVNGAQSSMHAVLWAGSNKPWKVLQRSFQKLNVSALQVQAAWILLATATPTKGFPDESIDLQNDLTIIVQRLKNNFPNIKIAYFSSRIYAGYANITLSPEPYAYETAFSVRWLIEDQINGNPELNYDPANGQVRSPLLLWGPYLWADGLFPRSDGLRWLLNDYLEDGTHPSDEGSLKAADMLIDYFRTSPLAKGWYTGN